MLPLDRPSSLPAGGPEVWVRRLEANEDLNFVSASPSFWLVYCHWAGDHSLPCYRDHKKCPGHRMGLPRRVRAYLYGWNEKARAYEFLELPPSAANEVQGFAMEGETLRGKRIHLKRGNGIKSRIRTALVGMATGENLAKLAADKDPAHTLVKLWGIEDLPINEAVPPSIPFAS